MLTACETLAVGLLDRVRAWWNKDTLERADEETRMTPLERDLAEEEFEGRKADVRAGEYLGGQGVDLEGDSKPPRHP
jgi:hypothetical protein